VARIETLEMLPDGRSNLSVAGVERVALDGFVDSAAPYHVARVTEYADTEPARPDDEARADSLRETFDRVIAAARVLTGEQRDLPPLPDDATLLVFRIAAMIDIDLDTRQRLLESRSPRLRLETMQAVLDRALPPLEQRAEIRTRAKGNGHGPLEA
jgi:Lon protease-like protein